jgi:plasmid stabilization system protein ParE
MAGRVIWTKTSLEDLETNAAYLARDSPRNASRFVRAIVLATERLLPMPRRARMAPELQDPIIRELLVKRHRIVFRIHGEDVEILSVLHGARDFLSFWRESASRRNR